jgi:hypothetical protein
VGVRAMSMSTLSARCGHVAWHGTYASSTEDFGVNSDLVEGPDKLFRLTFAGLFAKVAV